MRRDIVLVTLDCWRADTVESMPRTRAVTEGWTWEESTTHCVATHGAFASVFAGRHYPQVYTPSGALNDDVRTLMDVLSDAGYATGGFVASNPYVEKWRSRFDTFWNGNLTDTETDQWKQDSALRNAFRLLALRNVVTTATTVKRARRWFEETDRPRFCWIHLMDLHEPYLPGFVDLLGIGPVRAYRTLYERSRHGDAVEDRVRSPLRDLYEACVRHVDRKADDVLGWVPEEAVALLTGDHGEEFDHGVLKHERLYDEVVRVPMATTFDDPPRRHVDIAPTLLDEVDLDPPEEWMGSPTGEDVAILLNHSPTLEKTFLGARSPSHKYIRTHDAETGGVEVERYDLRADPDETETLSDPDTTAELEAELERYLDRDDVDHDALGGRGIGVEPAPHIESRLEDLGYR